jgi:hypothetical protein
VAASKPKTSAVAALRSSMPSVTITRRVAGQQRHPLNPVVDAGHYPERRIGGQLDVLDSGVADPERAGVPGVDHGAGAGGQTPGAVAGRG